MHSFTVVDAFEAKVAEFAGSRFAIATNTGTSAIFLSLLYAKQKYPSDEPVLVPAKTFISVPTHVLHAGLKLKIVDYDWSGVYRLAPYDVWDGALRFRKGMYQGGLHCLSFQARKLLNIGEGGMVLTDDPEADAWLRKARYSGRSGPNYAVEDIDMLGYQAYMTPEKAGRGLHLMEYIAPDLPDQQVNYRDLRKVRLFHD